jgi:hypothetical protein
MAAAFAVNSPARLIKQQTVVVAGRGCVREMEKSDKSERARERARQLNPSFFIFQTLCMSDSDLSDDRRDASSSATEHYQGGRGEMAGEVDARPLARRSDFGATAGARGALKNLARSLVAERGGQFLRSKCTNPGPSCYYSN